MCAPASGTTGQNILLTGVKYEAECDFFPTPSNSSRIATADMGIYARASAVTRKEGEPWKLNIMVSPFQTLAVGDGFTLYANHRSPK